jgi:phosphatidylserine/phosphatidylglycerophosphate/cardiolipin synthase-like enzyme
MYPAEAGRPNKIRDVPTDQPPPWKKRVILHSRTLRAALADVVRSARNDLLIASPYIKEREASWVCDELATGSPKNDCRLKVLTDIRSDSVLRGSLDLEALELFGQRRSAVQVVSLPRLHAKVYVADNRRALITSANLTPSGLDYNFEYGVCLDDVALVSKVREDLEAYARLGSVVSNAEFHSLLGVAQNLKAEFARMENSASRQLKASFTRTLHRARKEFLSAQVGTRSAHSLFAEAIIYALSQGPLPTEQLHPRVQTLLPDLCDDEIELVINGQRFGKRWKHAVRNAQQYLKRSGQIKFNGAQWSLVLTTNN